MWSSNRVALQNRNKMKVLSERSGRFRARRENTGPRVSRTSPSETASDTHGENLCIGVCGTASEQIPVSSYDFRR